MTIISVTLTNVIKPNGMDSKPTIELKNIRKHNIPFDIEDENSILEAACIYIARTQGGNTDYAEIDYVIHDNE